MNRQFLVMVETSAGTNLRSCRERTWRPGSVRRRKTPRAGCHRHGYLYADSQWDRGQQAIE